MKWTGRNSYWGEIIEIWFQQQWGEMNGYPIKAKKLEYDFNTGEVIWNTEQKSKKCKILLQQQWGDMEHKSVAWCDINKMPLRWASRWAGSKKNKETSQWGEMEYSSKFSGCGEIKYDFTRWCDPEDFPIYYEVND